MICKKCNVYMQPRVRSVIKNNQWSPYIWFCLECGREYPRVPDYSSEWTRGIELHSKKHERSGIPMPPLNWLVKGIPE